MNGTEEELKLKSPLGMAGILAVSVFVIELAIMSLIHLLPPIPEWITYLIDGSALTLLLLPVIYYFIFRPMSSYMAKISSLSAALKEEKEQINVLFKTSQESEEKYRNLVDTSPNGIFVHCEGRLVFINPAGARMLGAENPEQLIGRPVMDFVLPEDKDAVKERIRKILELGEAVPVFEEKFIRLDGTVIDVELSGGPLLYDNKRAVQGVAIDITERKKAEDALKKSRKEWESTFDAISDPIFIHDKEFRIVRANLAYQQASDMSLEEMAGRPYYEVFPKMEGPFSMCHKALKLQEEEEEEEEEEEVFLPYMERTFLVRFYPIKDDEGKFLYSIHTMEDITGRKQAEKEIMERIDELERFRKATVTREFRIKELRDENEELKRKLGIHKA